MSGMDMTRAAVAVVGDGHVVIDDPKWPWVVEAVAEVGVVGFPLLTSLMVRSRNDRTVGVTALRQLPLRQVAAVAAAALAGDVTEVQWRMLARQKPRGVRDWPESHYVDVARVAAWARATNRPGGGTGAVAEFWGVHRRTARRWLATPDTFAE